MIFLPENSNVCKYGDDTFYAFASDLQILILRLEHDSILAIECNYMKLSQDKCHLLILGHKYESV